MTYSKLLVLLLSDGGLLVQEREDIYVDGRIRHRRLAKEVRMRIRMRIAMSQMVALKPLQVSNNAARLVFWTRIDSGHR